jgi:beta-lactamase superfamily II metal-dependent hydrolase
MFTFTLFNVGHGFCAYATTPGGSAILFDCGYDDELQFYPSRYFSDRRIANIYSLALSHFDQDHVANLPALRKIVNFDTVTRNRTIPVDFIRKQKEGGGGITTAMASAIDMHEHWIYPVTVQPNYGGVKVTYFYNQYPAFTDMNNLSLVTFLEYEGCGIVIPGDLEREGWLELMKQPAFCQCLRETNFFIASHHGRNAGYAEEVFSYCKPHIVLLSDKSIVHDSQEHDYSKHATGIVWPNGQTRRVLTTRCDGHLRLTKQAGQPISITIGVKL